MAESLLNVEHLEVRRGRNVILSNLSLQIESGPPFAIVGESGSGKTTLLLAIMGLIAKANGSIEIQGKDISELPAQLRAQSIGLVFQDYALFPHFTVEENIVFAPNRHGQKSAPQKALELMEELRIAPLRHRYPHELSGGQRQRVAIVRSLILEPTILFFDEPSAALDIQTSTELAGLLKSINQKSQVIVVSHDIPFLNHFCENGVQMHAGNIIKSGPLSALTQANQEKDH